MLTKTLRRDLRTKPGVKQQRKREINSNQDPLLLSHSNVFYSQKNLGQNKRCCPQRFKDTQDNQFTMLHPFPVNHYHCHKVLGRDLSEDQEANMPPYSFRKPRIPLSLPYLNPSCSIFPSRRCFSGLGRPLFSTQVTQIRSNAT